MTFDPILTFEDRQRDIFEFLWSPATGLLRQYTTPDHLSKDRLRDEVNWMVEDMNREITSVIDARSLKLLLSKTRQFIRKRHGGRTWPTIKTLLLSLGDALNTTEVTGRAVTSENSILDMMQDWFRKHKGCMPSVGSDARTQALVDRGFFNLSEARFYGFPLSAEMRKIAMSQPTSRMEWEHHVGVMARLRNQDYADVEADLLAEKRAGNAPTQMPKVNIAGAF